ncbi:MAG: ABC transporter permease [Ruminiclostridium sp.]|nr:ABC transporter permease [Ruminiclostridium sp.]
MSYVIFVIICLSFIFSSVTGKMSELSIAALTSCRDAVTLCISLCGTICLWSGVMKVAERSGAVKKLSCIFAKPLGLLFPGIDKKGIAMQYIVMNFISNLLGLGNASTPLGIKAMQELKSEQKAEKTATRDMIMLVVMNTASVQFFPSTIVALRASYASATPADIVPCVWVVSLIALGVSVTAVFAADGISSRRKKK